MKIVSTFAEARVEYEGRVALVPTMGFFHEGHLSLIDLARSLGDTLCVSLFVNPLQFEDRADLARYPRDFDRDATLAATHGADLLFAPELEEMYPDEQLTKVAVARLSESMEGAHRPGHFEGVATVVTKLFAGLQPDIAVFGRKDAQQLAVVRRLAADLSFPVAVRGAPLVRERDGLALSSRNVFLDREHRAHALGMSQGLMEAADRIEQGTTEARLLEETVQKAASNVELEYAELADARTCQPLAALDRPAFLAVAGRVGSVRLIDNLYVDLAEDGTLVPDRGAWLESTSVLYREAT